MRRRAVCRVFIAALASVLLSLAAQAQSIEEFYRGKQLNMIIGYPTGGSNDIYARAVARHIGKHIPGNPTVIPRNMPGGGSLDRCQPRVQRRAEGRHYALADRAHHSAGGAARRAERQAQNRPSSTGSAASRRR